MKRIYKVGKRRILCSEHGRQEIIYVGKAPICAQCFGEKVTDSEKVPFKIIKESEMGTVIPFPVKKDDKD